MPAEWQVGSWGACTNSQQTRTVTCEAGKLCDPTTKPLSYAPCQLDLKPIEDDRINKGPDPDSGDIDYIEDHYDNLGGPLTNELGGFDRNHGNSLNLGI